MCIIPLTIWAAAITKPYTFSARSKASSSQVNENFDALYTKVNEHDSSLTNLVRPPIGAIIAWHKSLTGIPTLPTGWVECSGGTISDSDSPINGKSIPDLNGGSRFLRGAATSGSLQNDAFQGHVHAAYQGGQLLKAPASSTK